MSSGRVISSEISVSRRYNSLCSCEHGELAQLIYLLCYPHSDDWGHLPYDAEWVRYKAMPGTKRSIDDLVSAMQLLVDKHLWDTPYTVDGERYVHIWNFETKSREGLRLRRVGKYPDESGELPRRRKGSDAKPVPIDECIRDAQVIREHYAKLAQKGQVTKFSVTLRNVTENNDREEKRRDGLRRDEMSFKNPLSRGELAQSFSEQKPILENEKQIPETKKTEPEPEKTAVEPENQDDGAIKEIQVNGYRLKPSFIRSIMHTKKLRGDAHEFGRIVFRGVAKKPRDLKAWIIEGIEKGFAFQQVQDEYDDPGRVQDWIDKHVYSIQEGGYG